MRFEKIVSLCAVLLLSACANTMEGVHQDAQDFSAWAHHKPSLFQNYVGPAPTAYAGQTTGYVFKPSGISQPVVSPVQPQLVWQEWGSVPSAASLPPPSVAQPASAPLHYNKSVTVFPIDGDVPAVSYERLGNGASYQPSYARQGGHLAEQVFFAHGSAHLGTQDKRDIKRVARAVSDASNPRFNVVGHASKRVNGVSDPVERQMINVAMAQKRADIVTRELKKAGVKPAWIMASSRGDAEPNPHPGTKSQEAADRRVDIYVER